MSRSAPVPEEQLLEDWPPRPWLLGGIGALAGLLFHWIMEADGESSLGAAAAAFLVFAAGSAAFVLRPVRWREAALFALGLGVVMAGIAWLAADATDRRAGTEFAFAAGVFFSLLAIPLFQANFHRRRWATPYPETHFHVWTDAVSAGGAIAFMGLSWLLLWLLHALFSLIGIEVIEDLIQSNGFGGFFIGGTLGTAMGVLRNQLNIIGTLQRVVMLVFSLLAVPFAAAMVIFLIALMLSGGTALWEATDDATPVLLSCAVGCFVLANAVVRDDEEARSRNLVMQAAALVLAASIFPLTVFAAISMGIRIDQYGLAPERLWALVAIVIACAYGLAYWVGLLRGLKADWAHYLRRANLHLAVASCAVALFLALPILDFGAISAKNQVARLEAGKVEADDFDFYALRWDFGDAGREVLSELADRGEGEVARLAAEARDRPDRPDYYQRQAAAMDIEFRLAEDDPAIRREVEAALRQEPWSCDSYCVVIDVPPAADGRQRVAVVESRSFAIFEVGADGTAAREGPREAGYPELSRESRVEVRSVPTDYIFIDGEPLTPAIDGRPPAIEISPATGSEAPQ